MTDYERLLRKYNGKVPGELWSNESDRKVKRKQRIEGYLVYADYVSQELKLNKSEIEQLKYIIRNVHLKQLYYNKSYESIIICLAICLKMRNNPKCVPQDYKICNKYNVDWSMVARVMNSYCSILESRMPLPYNKC